MFVLHREEEVYSRTCEKNTTLSSRLNCRLPVSVVEPPAVDRVEDLVKTKALNTRVVTVRSPSVE